jgi:hypothetical protein
MHPELDKSVNNGYLPKRHMSMYPFNHITPPALVTTRSISLLESDNLIARLVSVLSDSIGVVRNELSGILLGLGLLLSIILVIN